MGMMKQSNRKVGLVAVTYKDNYGSALQTFATQYALQKMGCEVHIFEIRGVHKIIKIRKICYYLKRLFQPDERKYICDNVKSRFRKKMAFSADRYAQSMKERHLKYTEFYGERLKMLPMVTSWSELTKQAASMDAVVVGSDQLWRPSNIAGRYFTLEFVPDHVKKISCSTSFGVSCLPKVLHRQTSFFLTRMDYISVREETGKKIVKDIAGRDAQVVCDPTMLLDADEWMQIQTLQPIASGNYILCYFMGDNPLHREFAKRLKEITGYRIIALLHGATYVEGDEHFADETPYHVGPSEFLNLIRYSQYVCTDSFHGLVFSILYKRSFFSFRRYHDGSEFSTNDRLHTLLSWTGLEERLLLGNENVAETMKKTIDYDEVLRKVDLKRQELKQFLLSALA